MEKSENCLGCGKPLVRGRYYCSAECRRRYYDSFLELERYEGKGICRCCGGPKGKGRLKVFCSDACRDAYKARRVLRWKAVHLSELDAYQLKKKQEYKQMWSDYERAREVRLAEQRARSTYWEDD